MSNKAAKQSNNRLFNSPNRMIYAKILSFTVIILLVTTIICSTLPRDFTNGLIRIFINYPFIISFSLLSVSAILLEIAHGNAYRCSDKRRIKLDERQLLVRSRVFERSYLVICFFAIFLSTFIPSAGIQCNDPMVLVSFVCVMYSLPEIIASWQKDA